MGRLRTSPTTEPTDPIAEPGRSGVDDDTAGNCASGRSLDPRWNAVLWLVTGLLALPFLLPGWIPMTDLPEHAAAMVSIARRADPAFRLDEHYFVAWTTSQYLVVHLAGALLVKLGASADLACRVLLVGLAVAWVQSSRLLLRAFGADPRLTLMSALLFWNRALVVGFLPYVASLPILFLTVAILARREHEDDDRPAWRRRLPTLAALGVVVFYTHASAFTLLAAIAAGLAVGYSLHDRRASASGERRRPTAILADAIRRSIWMLPAILFAGAWLLRGRFAMNATSIHDANEIGTMNPFRAIRLISLYAHDIWPSHVDDWVGAGFWLVFLTLLFGSFRAPPGGTPEKRAPLVNVLPLLVAFVVYLATPFRVGTGLLLNVRMAPVLAGFALLGIRPARGRLGTLPFAAVIGLAGVQCADNVSHFQHLKGDVAGLPELLETLPKGSRLITLNFSGFDALAGHFTPWLHVGSYHRALNGGVASFSFSELPHWSVQYRPSSSPPKQAILSWGMRPCLYRNARDGEYFDFVLVRGALDPFKNHPPGPSWKVRGRTAKYTLYEKDSSRVAVVADPTASDEGPCAGLAGNPSDPGRNHGSDRDDPND
jgi:hypothetical protein